MKYEHEINWANVYDTNLDDCTGRSVRNGRIDLLSTLTFTRTDGKFGSVYSTLYDRKNQTNSYNFLRIKRVHAMDSSVSFKITSVDFDFLIDMLVLLQF